MEFDPDKEMHALEMMKERLKIRFNKHVHNGSTQYSDAALRAGELYERMVRTQALLQDMKNQGPK